MRRAIRSVVADMKAGRNVDNYILIALALVVAILAAAGVTSQSVVSAVLLAIMAALVYGQIKNSKQFESSQMQSAAAASFREDRLTLPPLSDRLAPCQEKVQILGVQLGGMVHDYLHLLESLASAGRSIELLLMSPVDKDGVALPWVGEVGQVHTFKNLERVLNDNLNRLSDWHSDLETGSRSRIAIRFYPSIPTVSMVMVDVGRYNGWVQVEPLIYHVTPSLRPSFTITRHSSNKLFERLVQSYARLWQSAMPLDEVEKLVVAK